MNSRRFIRSPVRRPVDHGGIVPGSRYHTPRWFHAWSEAGHGLEKIKTTGDAYMVVSGVPEPLPDHAAALGDLALDMRDALVGLADPKGRAVPVRIGIASGPVVAGVVGIRKFFYDVWGDAVNTAARMESTGEAGKIQVAPKTHDLLADRFEFEERGVIEVRGKGPMRTWFLIGRKLVDSEQCPSKPTHS